MRIAINGAGVAGPTLAYWLKRYGHEPVLFEKAPALRTGGYVIDFWGPGYDVAERMGLSDTLHERGYHMDELRMVGPDGRVTASLDVSQMREMMDGRFVSLPRGSVASAVYEACDDVESCFGRSVEAIEQRSDGVRVVLSDGTADEFDLVVGADGLHSRVRELAIAPEEDCTHDLGCCVAAFQLEGYAPRDELTYVSHTVPERQVARIALRGDATLFLMIFRTSRIGEVPEARPDVEATLREVFEDMRWEVPQILEQLGDADAIYFDRVSQIRLDRWTEGRVALVGDAAACASLMAGEGTGLAMTEAYVLAGELHRAGGDHAAAFDAYEKKLRDWLREKQEAAPRFVGFFAPKTNLGLRFRDFMVRLGNRPFFAKRLLASALSEDFELPDYEG